MVKGLYSLKALSKLQGFPEVHWQQSLVGVVLVPRLGRSLSSPRKETDDCTVRPGTRLD
ncbi:MAG: hypothetical protein VKK04_04975 [Synechococcales bacterium]|nr:hypothetical protein [Synechococcales bacterium]